MHSVPYMACAVAAKRNGTTCTITCMAAKCSSANVKPCRGWTNASRTGDVVEAATVQRMTPAIAARAIAPPGASRRTNRGPIHRKTSTSDNTDSDQRALMTGKLVPATRQRITENELCSAWLPSTRAAIMSKRRKAGICRREAQSRIVERARLLDKVGAVGILGSKSEAAPPIPSSVPLIQTMLASPEPLAVQPLSIVPTMNAAEPDARSHPYSNRLPSPD